MIKLIKFEWNYKRSIYHEQRFKRKILQESVRRKSLRHRRKLFLPGMVCQPVGLHSRKQYAENTVFEEKGGKICGPGVMHAVADISNIYKSCKFVTDTCELMEFAPVEALAEVQRIQRHSDIWATTKLRVGKKFSNFRKFIDELVDSVKNSEKVKIIYESRFSNSERYLQCLSNKAFLDFVNTGDFLEFIIFGGMPKFTNFGSNSLVVNYVQHTRIVNDGSYTKIVNFKEYVKIVNSGVDVELVNFGDNTVVENSATGIHIISFGKGVYITSFADYAHINVKGENSIVILNSNNCVKGCIGTQISFIACTIDGEHFMKTERVDGKRIKADTFYTLEDGKFTEVSSSYFNGNTWW